jgi:uncharacterized damage-inducible protein DinB
MKWTDITELHLRVARDAAAAAQRIPPDKWMRPRADGKWSPAEVVEHVNLAYDAFLQELAGGAPMKVKTKAWQRVLLRFTMVPKILRGGGFPKGARAPRETRPESPNPDQAAAVASFTKRAAEFEKAVARARDSGKRVRLTHAYFGAMTLEHSVVLLARHLEHHARQLV